MNDFAATSTLVEKRQVDFCVVFSDLDPCRLQICVDKNTSFLLSCSLDLTRCLFWQEEVVVLS